VRHLITKFFNLLLFLFLNFISKVKRLFFRNFLLVELCVELFGFGNSYDAIGTEIVNIFQSFATAQISCNISYQLLFPFNHLIKVVTLRILAFKSLFLWFMLFSITKSAWFYREHGFIALLVWIFKKVCILFIVYGIYQVLIYDRPRWTLIHILDFAQKHDIWRRNHNFLRIINLHLRCLIWLCLKIV